MMTSNANWWEQFFSGDNQLNYNALEKGSAPDNWSEDVMLWQNIAQDDNELPLVLPYIDHDGQVSWYAGANSEKTSQRLIEEIQAFIGSSYSDFDRQPIVIDTNNQAQLALSQTCSYHIFRVKPTNTQQIPKIRRAIKLYANLIRRHKVPEIQFSPSFGSIRSDFDKALLVGNEKQARVLLEKLKQIGRLSAENKIYLDIRLLAGLGEWEKIAYDSKRLKSLSDLPLPPQVLADIVEALYRVHIEQYEANNNAHGTLEAIDKLGAKQYSKIFSSRRGVNTPRVLKAFCLFELNREEPDTQTLQSLLKKLKHDKTGFVTGLSKLIPQSTEDKHNADTLQEKAEEAFDNYELERALNLYIQLPPSKKRLSRLISCTNSINDFEIAKKVLEIIDQEHSSEIEALSPLLKQTLESIRESAYFTEKTTSETEKQEQNNDDPREGWIEWARWVNTGVKFSEANEVLQSHSMNWSIDCYKHDIDIIDDFSNQIGNATDYAELIFRDSFPNILDAFVLKPEHAIRNYKPLLLQLFTLMIMMEDASSDELELIRELVSVLLDIGLTQKEYSELLENLDEILEAHLSLSTLAWVFDITESLVVNSCSSEEQRLIFFMKVLDLSRKLLHRLEFFHLASLKLLCKDFSVDIPAEFITIENHRDSEDKTDTSIDLIDKKLAIYTLTEGAGRRAKTILEELYHGLNVILNHDKTASKSLMNLADSADYFIFSSKSAAHQAFYPVSELRKDLIYPLGKGSTSIVRAFIQNLENA